MSPDALSIDFDFNQTCFGDVTYFNDTLLTPINDTLIAWNWNFGEPESGSNNFSTAPNPYHTYQSPGTYNVVLEAVDQKACTTMVYRDVVVDALPLPHFTYETGHCDSIVNFTDLSTGGDAQSIIGSGILVMAKFRIRFLSGYCQYLSPLQQPRRANRYPARGQYEWLSGYDHP